MDEKKKQPILKYPRLLTISTKNFVTHVCVRQIPIQKGQKKKKNYNKIFEKNLFRIFILCTLFLPVPLNMY